MYPDPYAQPKTRKPANSFGLPKANWATKPAGPQTLKQMTPTEPVNPSDYIQKGPVQRNPGANPSDYLQKVYGPNNFSEPRYNSRSPSIDEGLNQVEGRLHSSGPGSPRAMLAQSIMKQQGEVPYHSMAGERLYKSRNEPIPLIDNGESPNANTGSGIAVVPQNPSPRMPMTEKVMGYYGIANHENEHATRQLGSTRNREIAPVLGDMVFRSEQFAQENGKPLQHTARLPGGVSHDINWMREQAKKYGYWDGKSMTQLLSDPIGQQYVAKMKGAQPGGVAATGDAPPAGMDNLYGPDSPRSAPVVNQEAREAIASDPLLQRIGEGTNIRSRMREMYGGPVPVQEKLPRDIQAANALNEKWKQDTFKELYGRTPSTPAAADVQAAKDRYLAANGPSMGQQTDRLNAQADRAAELRAGSESRINSSVPYGARNVYSPLEGEGEAEFQRSLSSGVPSQEELLASNKAQVDGMRATREFNDTVMSNRPTNQIQDPTQMRIDMQATTDAYNIYKRKGGKMGFRQWAGEADIQNPDVRAQLKQNYPGTFDKEPPNQIVSDMEQINEKGNYTGDTSALKNERRREALQKLYSSPRARIADAVAHGANPNEAWAVLQNQGRQDDLRRQYMDMYKTEADAERANKIAVEKAGRISPDEQAAADIRARKNAARDAYVAATIQNPMANQATKDATRRQIETMYGVTLDQQNAQEPASSGQQGSQQSATGSGAWQQKFQDSGPLENNVAGWKQFADNIGGDVSAIKDASEYSKFDVTPEKARGIYDSLKDEAETYAEERANREWWNKEPGDQAVNKADLFEKYYKEFMADKKNLTGILKHLLPGEPDIAETEKHRDIYPRQSSKPKPRASKGSESVIGTPGGIPPMFNAG